MLQVLKTPPKRPWPPNYTAEFKWRQNKLFELRKSKKLLLGALTYYSTAPKDFINHWCLTYDPRNAGTGLPTKLPFITFEKQDDFIDFIIDCLKEEQNGLVEKCRDVGATWVCAAISVWLWRFVPGVSVGWGSRKEKLVDELGDPDSIFEKMRIIIFGLPIEFWPKGFNPKEHISFMRIINPENGATITGEAGDDIGRGGRKRIYFKDESAHYVRPERIEAALADNTRCQIDISSVNGPGNVFHRRREASVLWQKGRQIERGKTRLFIFDVFDHPAKTRQWYNERKRKAEDDGLLHIFAQEVDRNYYAAVEGIIIPAEWVEASIDAHIKLNLPVGNNWGAGFDVADGGDDRNAIAVRQDWVVRRAKEFGGRDVGASTRKVIGELEGVGQIEVQYDSIGVGSGVKSEVNRLLDDKQLPRGIVFVPWNAGAEVQHPKQHIDPEDDKTPVNGELFTNIKAQAWWHTRLLFQRTYQAVVEKKKFPTSQLISLDSKIPELHELRKQLSQATMGRGTRLKMVVNKMPKGTRSPNLADGLVMCNFPIMEIVQSDIGSPVSIVNRQVAL